jgi:hypothetical protein
VCLVGFPLTGAKSSNLDVGARVRRARGRVQAYVCECVEVQACGCMGIVVARECGRESVCLCACA